MDEPRRAEGHALPARTKAEQQAVMKRLAADELKPNRQQEHWGMRDNMVHEVRRTELEAKLFQQAKSNAEPSIKPRCANKQQTDRAGMIDMR